MKTVTLSNPPVNKTDLEEKVKKMYREVALHPEKEYHFEIGRKLAEKLGYETKDLDRIPAKAVASFAGVGYFFDLAGLKPGEKVLDLGSGSGMDVFIAALKVDEEGEVIGIDMTDEQLTNAEKYRSENNFKQVRFIKGQIETLPFEDRYFDAVISNGVINLSPVKEKIFSEIARVLKPGGRMAIADIVSEKQLPETVVCNADLWASCIGGASQQDSYRQGIEETGLEILIVRNNDAYHFLSKSAAGASSQYGVKSVSLLAEKKKV